ncbi:MAG: diaminopimelate decarboxylase [Candidatus Yanofskybacteria bacterium RIFCSPHIGHO2_01_FULL_41_21]|uniref:Diaminopimelate decarboxylase n=1 Tax=Candidatus Yanofskybacteria bacterium RIFCSPHIGHO2_01_FULL_41_21 TaxID=1802660 RepID=A0A1F8EC27_9BACT|nr:MAG: diaminopimelate decarboxylase [Candidatus Yanofskybacteria bacterium RIFCSPHIGHO2_01_FULL_41_21]
MKNIPFTEKQIRDFVKDHPTPFYVYDEDGIRHSARKLIDSFSWNSSFKEFFAVKATPNPSILTILKEEGCGADCSSFPELLLAERVGIRGEDIMFTSNDTPAEEFRKASELGAIINLDDLSHLDYLEKEVGLPELISFRYNPGSLTGNVIIGTPKEAKFGITKEQLLEAYRIAKEKGVKRFGLHTMIASNELNPQHFINTAEMIFDIALELKEKIGIKVEFINLGGGFGIPYKPEQEELDLSVVSEGVQKLYEKMDMAPIRLFFESGRYITGPHGYLISRVRHIKNTYKKYIGLDASMADLMRPGMYGAYHHITVLGKEKMPYDVTCDVTGSLCENNDKFAVDRKLPEINTGDIVIIYDVGAHGHSMGFNYNGKLRSSEFLLGSNGKMKIIRRAETINDYFATLNF